MKDNPYMKRCAKNGTTGHGAKSEARIAKYMRARLSPASGAMVGAKGDARTEDFLIECKSTVAETMKLDLGWLVKIATEARAKGLDPALTISFVTPEGKPRGDRELVPVA